MPAAWESSVRELVRKHGYNFNAAALEVGATAKEVRTALASLEFGPGDDLPPPAVKEVPPATSPPAEEKWDAEAFFTREKAAELARRETRDRVFGRVLTAMGGATIQIDEDDPIVESWRSAKEAEAATDLERDAKLAELRMTREIAEQREALRQRFDVNSADAQGIDPLSKEEQEEEEEDNELLHTSSFARNDLDMASLDAALDALEATHSGEEANSAELDELFALMDSAPKANLPASITQMTTPVAFQPKPPQPPVMQIAADAGGSSATATVAASSRPKVAEPPPRPARDVGRSTTMLPITQQQPARDDSMLPTSPTVAIKHAASPGRRGTRAEVFSDGDDGDVGKRGPASSGDESEDSDDDWRAQRQKHKLKAAANVV